MAAEFLTAVSSGVIGHGVIAREFIFLGGIRQGLLAGNYRLIVLKIVDLIPYEGACVQSSPSPIPFSTDSVLSVSSLMPSWLGGAG